MMSLPTCEGSNVQQNTRGSYRNSRGHILSGIHTNVAGSDGEAEGETQTWFCHCAIGFSIMYFSSFISVSPVSLRLVFFDSFSVRGRE
jgi:hypothetical protein